MYRLCVKHTKGRSLLEVPSPAQTVSLEDVRLSALVQKLQYRHISVESFEETQSRRPGRFPTPNALRIDNSSHLNCDLIRRASSYSRYIDQFALSYSAGEL